MTSIENHIRVRFAPSPTGYLHIGGARTAIFNWLFARQNGGDFLIRIEDTDIERSDPELVDSILESMDWLGLSSDEPVVFQSENLPQHKKAVNYLLGAGLAYPCFCTPEELEQKRQQAESPESSYRYDKTCRALPEEEVKHRMSADMPYAVRFKVQPGWLNFKDKVYKKVSINREEIDDFILQRRDGTPVYQLAVVVDDVQMGITHVIRGEDHLSNTPKQILLYEALGYQTPHFAHVPLILGEDGKRLSKRHGATDVGEFKKRGYLHTAIVNYLALLGWTPKSNEEIFMPDDLIDKFELSRISKNSAVFDDKKLAWVSGQHFKRWKSEDLVPFVRQVFDANGFDTTAGSQSYLIEVIELLKSRVRTLGDFYTFGAYFWEDPKLFSSDAVEKYWDNDQTTHRMRHWNTQLQRHNDFSAESLESLLRETAEDMETSAAGLIHPTRIAITGTAVSPDIFKVMALLGKETLIRRIDNATERLA